jgi:hypothetical protein
MKRTLVLLLVAGVSIAAFMWWTRIPEAAPAPETRSAEAFAQMPIGKVAPDFDLPQLPGGRRVRLSESRGRPTVLMFGSFSCDLFCSQLPELERLHREYGDKANFTFVYIREAGHDNAVLDEHMRKFPEASDRVAAGLEIYSVHFTCLDGRDSEVIREYQAWPERLYLLDANGVAVWDSGSGYSASGLRLDEAGGRLRELVR